MPKHSQGRGLRDLFRFYRFALPHWRWIVLTVVGTVLFAGISFSMLMLVRPMIQTLMQSQTADAALEAETPEDMGSDDAAPPADLDELEDEIELWLMNLAPVRRLMQWLTPDDDPNASMKRLAWMMGLIIGPLFVLFALMKNYSAGRVMWGMTIGVRVAVFDHLTQLSLGYFGTQRQGELISRLTNDVNSTRKAIRILLTKVLLQPLMFAVFLTGAFITSWRLTLLSLIVLPPMALITSLLGRTIRRYSRKTLERMADVTDTMSQTLSGMRVVKSFNQEGAERARFGRRNAAQLKRALKLVRNRALAASLPEVLLQVPIIMMLLVGGTMLRDGSLDFASMMQWLAAVALVVGPVRRGIAAYNDLQESMAGVTRIFELLDQEPQLPDAPDAVSLDTLQRGIRFDDVWFGYNGEEPVLRGLTLDVPRGAVYAIVGETGAGKSTMLDLLARFHDVTGGSIAIDDVDVRKIRRSSLMGLCAIVGQSPYLFNRSVADNIRYGKPEATDEEVVAAARAANIHDFVAGLPDGYETLVGETGSRLSGGQRQCVTIARAILKDAPILMLDEATSSLDAESERLVQEALAHLMEQRTTFVIAHRLSTVRHADRILVISGGVIAEQGTHDELLAAHGEYERLHRLQFGGAGE
jgi:ATP-binding cassette, subfamily B, bacterial MsbA